MSDLDDLAAAVSSHQRGKSRTPDVAPVPVRPTESGTLDYRTPHNGPSKTSPSPFVFGAKFALGATAVSFGVAIAIVISVVILIVLSCAGLALIRR